MPDKLYIQVRTRGNNVIPSSADCRVSIQHDFDEPRQLTRVRDLELKLDSGSEPIVKLSMWPHDCDVAVELTPENSAAILKLEHGRSLHFLDEDDRRALEDLFGATNRTTAAERGALGKILIELDLRTHARTGGG